MTQKTFQNDSAYGSSWDANNDGEITDAEITMAKEIKTTEDELRKHLAQLRMARYTLIAMAAFTVSMFFIPLDRVKALSDISNLFYLIRLSTTLAEDKTPGTPAPG